MQGWIRSVVSVCTLVCIVYVSQGFWTTITKDAVRMEVNIPPLVVETTIDDCSSRDDIFESRRRHIAEVCASEGRPVSPVLKVGNVPSRMYVGTSVNLLYCWIQKVASTFWERVMASINSQGIIENPYEIRPRRMPNVTEFSTIINAFSEDAVNSYLNKSTTLIVVRDPYTRLLSGYADKLYHPCYFYWDDIGSDVKRFLHRNDNDRSNEEDSENVCGHNVTFSEFVKYLIYMDEHDIEMEHHFTPLYKHCDPCQTRYDYVIKIETFKEDTLYVLSKFEKKFGVKVEFKDFEGDTALDIAWLHAHRTFKTKKHTVANRCNITEYSLFLRAWRWLQLCGIMPKEKEMPFSDGPELRLITEEKYIDVVRSVLAEGVNRTALKLQRREAFLQAYSTVPLDDLMKLRQYLLPDFLYFDYDDMPAELFTRDNHSGGVEFNYFEGL